MFALRILDPSIAVNRHLYLEGLNEGNIYARICSSV